jgi:hypothetical protein
VAAALLAAVLPIAAHAQATRRTACNDGSTTSSVGSNACDGHGGINKGKTSLINRTPRHTETGHVAQAGTPTSSAHTPYEERRGWRWGHKDDKRDAERRREDERRREEERRRVEERRRAERHDRVKCRDGRFESAKGKGKAVCKNHGGLAH